MIAPAQSSTEERAGSADPAQTLTAVRSLELTPAQSARLNQALRMHNYVAAERVLLPEVHPDQHTPHTIRLLDYLGGIYFLDQDYLNAAVAWKKSAAIAPLDAQLSFSLAMAYLRLGHSAWARDVLTTLAAENPKEALYPYWLGRLAYDAHAYDQAIQHLQQAITLAPAMSRAYDNLGLCYYYLNRNDLAVDNYKKAIALESKAPQPSAWPYINLATALEFLNQSQAAAENLRRAIQLDSDIPIAHFQLGNILEKSGQSQAAIIEFHQAARLDPHYAEPHFALARTYNKLGRKAEADAEVQIYLRLHNDTHPH